MSFLILGHVVVTVLAFRTLQSNSCAHNFHLAFNIFTCVLLMVAKPSIFRHKKKTYFHSPCYCSTAPYGKSSLFLRPYLSGFSKFPQAAAFRTAAQASFFSLYLRKFLLPSPLPPFFAPHCLFLYSGAFFSDVCIRLPETDYILPKQ